MDKKEFNLLLKNANIAKKEFAEIIGMKYSSVNNWGGSQKFPRWVKSWLENYIKANDIQEVSKTVKSVEKIIEKQSESQKLLNDLERIQELLKGKKIDTLLDFIEAIEPFADDRKSKT